jgi:ZIP family zinc transporter
VQCIADAMTAMPLIGLNLAFAAAAGGVTYAGGRIALQLSAYIPLLLSITAGMVLGIAFFDLLPQSFAASAHGRYSPNSLFFALAAGMMLYMVIDRLLGTGIAGGVRLRPHLWPAGLTLHSLFDGLGMGLAFRVSLDAGIAVALAVIAHDIADGINTVGLSLAGDRRDIAHRWVIANAAAPFVGVVIATRLEFSQTMLAPFLAGIAGVLLYIGACEILPRNCAAKRPLLAGMATLCGIAAIYVVVRLSHG